jgi:hypothetical protein
MKPIKFRTQNYDFITDFNSPRYLKLVDAVRKKTAMNIINTFWYLLLGGNDSLEFLFRFNSSHSNENCPSSEIGLTTKFTTHFVGRDPVAESS